MKSYEIKDLPEAVQQKIRSRLRAFSTVDVWQKANGEYTVSASTFLSAGPSPKYIGEYKAEDVFTMNERVVNYVNEFREFPSGHKFKYNGKKDYRAMQGDWTVAEMVDGNIAFN